MNVKEIDLNTGAVMIRYGIGGKTRMVFIGRKTRRAMRAYLRLRHDSSPALFVSKDEERLTYDGLRQLLERRAKRAKLSYPQSNLLALNEKLTDRQLRLTGGEISLWSHKNSKQANSSK